MNMKAHIYYSKACEMSSASFALHCAQRYCKANHIAKKPLEIEKLPSGKLILKDSPLHISIAHSKGRMACAVHHSNIGIDLEMQQPKDVLKIAQRFFNQMEVDFIKKSGPLSFYILWTMKESFCKYSGQPLLKILGELQTVGETGLVLKNQDYILEPFCLDNKFVFCSCKSDSGFKLIML